MKETKNSDRVVLTMKTFCECTLLITLLVVTDAPATRSTNILGVFPTKTASHFKLGWALMHGLAEAGHNVTLISPYEFPKRDIGRNSIETQIHLIYLKDTTFFTGGEYIVNLCEFNNECNYFF